MFLGSTTLSVISYTFSGSDASKLEINPDHALSKANKKFTFRFNKAEKLAESDNKRFSDLPLIEQEKYWQKAKNY